MALSCVDAGCPACKPVNALQTDEAALAQRCSGVCMPTMQCRGDKAGMALSCDDVCHPALKPLYALQTDEVAIAVELWWRGSAVEALRAFVLGPLAQAGRSESVRLQKTIGSLLQPTLDAISSLPAIMVRLHGGPGQDLLAGLALIASWRPDSFSIWLRPGTIDKLCSHCATAVPSGRGL